MALTILCLICFIYLLILLLLWKLAHAITICESISKMHACINVKNYYYYIILSHRL